MAFDRLLDILKKAQGRYPGFSKRLHEAEALGRWESAVGPAIAKHARAIRVQDEVLWVEVDHPIWKSELHHRKRQILEILNQGHSEEFKAEKAKKPRGPAALEAAKEILKDILFLDSRPKGTNPSRFGSNAATPPAKTASNPLTSKYPFKPSK